MYLWEFIYEGLSLLDSGWHEPIKDLYVLTIKLIFSALEMAERSMLIRPKMKYEVMDVLKMTYDDGAFDSVLDKGKPNGNN